MPSPPRGLWSNRPGDGRSLFRGKCRNETLAVQAGSPFRGSAKHSRPWQGLVQQRVTNPGGTAGSSTPKHRRYGSDPPENGPGLRKRAFRGGRSRDLSLQEGGAALKGRGGIRRRHPECHAPLSGYAVRVEVQCLVVRAFDCGNSIGLSLSSTDWGQARRIQALSSPILLDGRRKASATVPSISDSPPWSAPKCPQNPSPSPAALCGLNRGPANRQGRHRGGDGFHPRLHWFFVTY